ncbi:hypothetical protein, partial [Rummeliibacillus sp. POC4]|uniref:hypothetical protein n=2 Tax=Rummeliibacillus TaxID=648802 RepID=UPI000EC2CED1
CIIKQALLYLSLLLLIISGCSTNNKNHKHSKNNAYMDGYIFFYEDKDLSSVIFLSEESGIESEELNYLSILEITEKYSNYYFIVGAEKTFIYHPI